MRFGSVCSGIEAASVAWKPLGWTPVFLSEIEPFPCAVLHHHYGAGRPRFMPDPQAEGLKPAERKERLANIKAVAGLPETPTGHAPNLGDLTQWRSWNLEPGSIDLLVGGTPCQDLSIAGKRAGITGGRSRLAFDFLDLLAHLRPRWVVWENVAGALSSNQGRDFGAFLGGLAERGYGFAYRVLDAQYVRVESHPGAVPQRRRRVFVVGHLGDWRRAAAVLLERESLRGNPPPRREAGQRAAPTISSRTSGGGGLGTDFDCDGGLIPHPPAVAGTLCDGAHMGGGLTGRTPTPEESSLSLAPPVANTLTRRMHKGVNTTMDEGQTMVPEAPRNGGGFDVACEDVAHALRAGGFDASEDGTGRGTPLIAFHGSQDPDVSGDVTHPLSTTNNGLSACIAFKPGQSEKAGGPFLTEQFAPTLQAENNGSTAVPAVAFSCKDHGADATAEVAPTMRAMGHSGSHANAGGQLAVASAWQVRRLTPLECERLMGKPDYYTLVPFRGKPAADGPRYKALGNGIATNCLYWIGERIDLVEAELAK